MTERQSRISSHYVIAELAAFPFASQSSLRHCPTALCPRLKQQSTSLLWRDAERHILSSLPSMSLDEFVAHRDSLWFDVRNERRHDAFDNWPLKYDLDGSPTSLPLLHVLKRFADRVLHYDGSVGRPRLWTGDFIGHDEHANQHARNFWKWISLSLPPDLLLAASHFSARHIDPITAILERRLRDGGFAEVHVHFGASLKFADFWAMACNTMLDPRTRFDTCFSPGACLDEGRRLASWILRALVVRFLITGYMIDRSRTNRRPGDSFSKYIAEREVSLARGRGVTMMVLLRRIVDDFRRGKLSDGDATPAIFHTSQRLFVALQHELHRVRRLPFDPEYDPIAACFDETALDANAVELKFLRLAFSRLSAQESDDDPWFSQCLWQCIRVRGLLYRHVVQRPLTPGLPWFIRTFARLSAGKECLSSEKRIQFAARCSGAQKGLQSLELRTSPDDDPSNMLDLITAARNLRDKDPRVPEVGLVLHFVRDRGDGMIRGMPTAGQHGGHADPGRKRHAQGARYGEWYRQKRQEAFALAFVLRSFSEALEFIRGIDLCADEAGIPTWVVKPLVTYLRKIGRVVSGSRPPSPSGRVIPGLHMTVHAGEDWLHLIGGLRRIHEAHEHFEMGSGDRIGHGLALGVDPERWARESGPIAMPKETRLFDLIWAWTRHRAAGSTSVVKMETEIRSLMNDIFGGEQLQGAGTLDPWLASKFVQDLHDENVLRRLGFPGGATDGLATRDASLSQRLVHRYLYDVAVFRRGQRITHVDPRTEGPLVAELQKGLRDLIGSNDIAIEINPSSNFLTNQLPSLREHPTWRLRKGGAGDESLPIVIGSDDPLVFATNLREEYQLLHDALVLEGKTTDDAYRWIEEVRENGLKYRWTIAAPPREEDGHASSRHGLPSTQRRPLHPASTGRATDDVPLPP